MRSERAYPRFGQASLLVGVLLSANVLAVVALHVAGFGDTAAGGGEGALIALTSLLVLHWAWRRTGRPRRVVFGWHPVRPILLAPLLLMTVGFSVTLSEVDNLLRYWLPIPPVFSDVLRDLFRPEVSSFVGVGLVAPVVEELLFRGLILHGFLQHYRRSTAILASGALFAVSHLNPVQVVPALALGVTYAWLRIRAGSLWPCLIAHSLHNSLIWLLSAVLPVQVPGYTLPPSGLPIGEFQPLWFDVVGLLALTAGLFWLARVLPRKVPHVGPHDAAAPGLIPDVPGTPDATWSPTESQDEGSHHP